MQGKWKLMTRMNELPENAKVKSSIGGENYKRKPGSENIYKPENAEKEETLKVPGKLPTLNEFINAAKENIYPYSQLKKKEQNKVKWYVKQQNIPFFEEAFIEIRYFRPDKRADIDNISSGAKKVILDALVEMGTIQDDCWSVVKGFKESFEVDKDNPRTEVILKEVKDES